MWLKASVRLRIAGAYFILLIASHVVDGARVEPARSPRTILAQYRDPMLIIHGTRDRNVPIAAALEHHQLVPQSQIVELDDKHFMAFMHPLEFLDPLVHFLSAVP